MFSYFKGLNKKIICSTCLLCMIGTSHLLASDTPPLAFQSTVTMHSTKIGENAFLTENLQDHIYTSRLLPIFDNEPVLYTNNGKLELTTVNIDPSKRIPYGNEENISVYIAAIPYDTNGEYSFDNLKWYYLNPSSWNSLCLRYPRTYALFYHVVSNDTNITGTINDTSRLNIVNSGSRKVDLFPGATLPALNPNTKILGFRCYDNVNSEYKTIRMSNNPENIVNADTTFSSFLTNLLKRDYTLTGQGREYNENGSKIYKDNTEDHDLTIEPDIYSFCKMMEKLAEKDGNTGLIEVINTEMQKFGISAENPYGKTDNANESSYEESLLQSNGEALPELNDKTKALGFYDTSKLLLKWSPLVADGTGNGNEDLKEFVKTQLKKKTLASKNGENVRQYNDVLGLSQIEKNDKILIQNDLYSCLNLLKKLAIQNNDQAIIEEIDSLMAQYHITKDTPDGVKS